MGPNRELNDAREILSAFESLGDVFSETSEYHRATGGQTQDGGVKVYFKR